MKMATINSNIWNVFENKSAEQTIHSAKITPGADGVSLNLVIRGLNGKEYIVPNVVCVTQSSLDSILFVEKNNQNVAIILEDGDDVTWLNEDSKKLGVCVLDSFKDFTIIGKYLKGEKTFRYNDYKECMGVTA